ncbi:MAG: type II toxin-antitoxin system VapC family toxin [Xanthomonadaceae bacterium]|nr:type II toxin-antitoxin system VapC family toxin [Xanthomonadaceae bacterium]
MNSAIGLDTNILARYYVEDAADAASARQREQARRLLESGVSLAVCSSVVLELEWILRGYYGFSRTQVQTVLRHLLAQPHIRFDDRQVLERALDNHAAGLDFADALHHASYSACDSMVSFDDRGFARRSAKLGLQPPVRVPKG